MNITVTENILLNTIKNSLHNKIPLLISRFGEGEMRMFDTKNETDWILKNTLGYVPSEDLITEIRNNLELALVNSDITGLPSHNGYSKEEDVMKTDLHFLYKKIYTTFKDIFNRGNKTEFDFEYCDVNVHSKFYHKKLFDSLLMDIDELTIITCRDIENDLKEYFNIETIKKYKIPPEYRFEDDVNSISWNFYPHIHHSIVDDITSKDNSGKLLLYGAGLAGKDLGYYFKKSGGVAFDIGSVFDTWAGKNTRGSNKGIHSYSESPLKKF